jgi:hypothetical protein
MKTRMIVGLSALGLAVVGLGCDGGSLSLAYHDHHRPVYVEEPSYVHVSHVCTQHCDHYWDGSGYVVIRRGHVHGPHCGHVWRGNRWIVIAKAPAAPARRDVHIRGPRGGEVHVHHVHGPDCGHAFDRHGSKWVVVRHGHIHGPHCGHAYIEGRWTIRY